jgi:hypothetical protein
MHYLTACQGTAKWEDQLQHGLRMRAWLDDIRTGECLTVITIQDPDDVRDHGQSSAGVLLPPVSVTQLIGFDAQTCGRTSRVRSTSMTSSSTQDEYQDVVQYKDSGCLVVILLDAGHRAFTMGEP